MGSSRVTSWQARSTSLAAEPVTLLYWYSRTAPVSSPSSTRWSRALTRPW